MQGYLIKNQPQKNNFKSIKYQKILVNIIIKQTPVIFMFTGVHLIL